MENKSNNMGQQGLRDSVMDAGLCTGCGACVNLCPYQKAFKDHTIVLFPCDLEEGRCYAYCPRTPVDMEALRQQFFDAGDITPEIGPIKGFYVARASDAALRDKAQHGGCVSALVSLALEEGIIDHALLAKGEANLLPHSVDAATPAEVCVLAGSKLVVSPTVAEFNLVAKGEAQRIGVVATPCQALALTKMRTKPIPTEDNLIDKLSLIIGVFCGWAFDWRDLKALIETRVALEDFAGMDIPPSKYHCLEVFTKAGDTIAIDLDEVEPCVRNACHYCSDMTAEFSDISVGSARLDEGWEEARGWNQIIVRTKLGLELIEKAKEKGVLEFHEVPEGNLERLKKASMSKKRTAVANLQKLSGTAGDLVYLDPEDPVFSTLLG